MHTRIQLLSAPLVCVFGLAVANLSLLQPVSATADDQVGRIGGAIAKGALSRPKLTDEDEARLAQAYAQKFEAEHKIWPDPLLQTYVTGIVQKLVAVAERRPYPYRVRIVGEPDLNALTPGGGLLYIYAGLVARLENEAQLATVLAHEIAHVTERHVTKGIERAYGLQVLGDVAMTTGTATGVLPNSPALGKVYEYSMAAAINGHGRDQERAADRIGMEYLVRAGYDPREGPITFELLLAEHGDQARLVNFFYGSHPANQERFDTLTRLTKTKYASDVAGKRLVVNTEDFKRVTRQLVIAMGRVDYESQRITTAKAMFEKAVRAWQDDPVPHYYLGKIALETGAAPDGVDAAIAHLQAAVTADGQFAPAHRDLGLAYYRKSDRPKAITSLEQYLVIDPKAADTAQIKAIIEELKRFGR